MGRFSTNTLWLLLLMATALTYGLGEAGQLGQASMLPVFLIFGMAFLKGRVIILDFMELRHAPRLWGHLLLGWLGVILSLIVFAYWLGLR